MTKFHLDSYEAQRNPAYNRCKQCGGFLFLIPWTKMTKYDSVMTRRNRKLENIDYVAA